MNNLNHDLGHDNAGPRGDGSEPGVHGTLVEQAGRCLYDIIGLQGSGLRIAGGKPELVASPFVPPA